MIAIFLNMLLPMAATPARPATPAPRLSLNVTADLDNQRTLFSWPGQRCADRRMQPDAPVRAFRRADGQITLISGSYVNWTMTGPSFDSLKVNCDSVFSPEGAGAGDQAWIEATYTPDGRTVGALLSREIADDKRPGACVPGPDNSCWLGDIIAARSTDMGQNYSKGSVVATLGDKRPANGRRYGAFTTSNIAKGPNGFYTIAFLEAKDMIRGNCLLRSDDPLDPARWRGWDGKGFTLNMNDPASAQRCATLANLNQPVRSIAWVSAKKRWIAVLSDNKASGGRQRPGVYFADSPNLFRWNTPRLLADSAISLVGPEVQQRRWFYPVILDPNSKSRNFDTIDHPDALLIFVAHRPGKGKGPINKNLVTVNVHIE
ncbi:hypothetical protein ACFOKF_04400 [Sphingobium rhizovicinum]|uniref:Uncharacterized protein n=1 Tax=Sphingobium rhizovicinum TaxID=432308 RepID=A0ABV7NAB4_9SPHN